MSEYFCFWNVRTFVAFDRRWLTSSAVTVSSQPSTWSARWSMPTLTTSPTNTLTSVPVWSGKLTSISLPTT